MPRSPRLVRCALVVLALVLACAVMSVSPTSAVAAPPTSERAGATTTTYASGTAPPGHRRPLPRITVGKILKRMLTLVNVARALPQKCGKKLMSAAPAVKRNKRLTKAARKYAKKMARKDFFAHDDPKGNGPGDRIDKTGYQWSKWGENIAAGYDAVPRVIAGWLASPGHCRTLMGPYRHVGFGYAFDADSTYGHYWVQDFASPK